MIRLDYENTIFYKVYQSIPGKLSGNYPTMIRTGFYESSYSVTVVFKNSHLYD